MTYTPTTWNNDNPPPLSAENLNHMETGIADAHTGLTTKADLSGATFTGPIAVQGTGGLLALFYNFIGPLADYPPDAPISDFLGAEITPDVNWNNKQFAGKSIEYVRLQGFIKPIYSEMYTFYVTLENGARLFINGSKIIDYWQRTLPGQTLTAQIQLRADQWASILLEHANFGGGQTLKLEWSSATQIRQVVPSTAFKWSLLPESPTVFSSQNIYAQKKITVGNYDVWNKGEIVVSATAPSNPAVNTVWIDLNSVP